MRWKSLKDLIASADPILGSFGDASEELAYPLLGHLTEFFRQGRVEARDIHGLMCWWRLV